MPRLSIVVWLPLACKGSSQKRAGAKDRLPKMSPRWGERAVWKPKSPKTGMVGRLFEVAGRKICTRRGSRLEVKLVERWHDRSTFGRSGRQNLHHAVARERLGSKSLKAVAASEHFLVEPCKICTRLWRESRLEVKLVERWHDIWEHFWKVRLAKFAPRCGARAVGKSKSLKTGVGALFS